MAVRKQKKTAKVAQIIEKLKSMGAHELTDEEKQLPSHKKSIAEFEAYLKQKREARLAVRERQASYRTKRAQKAKRGA